MKIEEGAKKSLASIDNGCKENKVDDDVFLDGREWAHMEAMNKKRKQETRELSSTPPTFDEICGKLGVWGLKVDDRSGFKPFTRMAIWHYMYGLGVKITDIARQSERSHPTVWSGIKKFSAYLEYGDRESLRLSEKINLVMATNGYVVDKKYQKLFLLMKSKHNVTLTDDELKEIIDIVSNIK